MASTSVFRLASLHHFLKSLQMANSCLGTEVPSYKHCNASSSSMMNKVISSTEESSVCRGRQRQDNPLRALDTQRIFTGKGRTCTHSAPGTNEPIRQQHTEETVHVSTFLRHEDNNYEKKGLRSTVARLAVELGPLYVLRVLLPGLLAGA